MSFNYLEVEKSVQEINAILGEHGAVVEDLDWVDFPVLPKRLQKLKPFTDVNLCLQVRTLAPKALGASESQSLVFSFRSPWVGLFLLPSAMFNPNREWADFERGWKKSFGEAISWRTFLLGSRLTRVTQVPKDRVIVLDFASAGGEPVLKITVELFPARPNWRVEFLEGAPVPEEALGASGKLQWRGEKNAKALGDATVAPREVRAMVPRPTFLRVFEKGQSWFEKIYFHYLQERRKTFLEQLLTKARVLLDARFTKLLKLRTELGASLEQSHKAQEYRAKAESIKAVLHSVSKDAHLKSIEVYSEQGQVAVPLDAKFTVSENVDRLFQQYKKLQRTQVEVKSRLETLDQKSKTLAHQIADLRGFKKHDGEEYIAAAERLMALFPQVFLEPKDAGQAAALRSPKKDEKKWAKSGVRSFVSNEGLKIWIGKNHKENEELVIRLARGNDLWLHLKGKPGAHAVVQLPQGKSAALETLLDAAVLVAHYSGVSQFDRAEVDYTFRKYVKRVPGQKEKFLVTYTQNKTLNIKPDPARLQRLLAQE